MTLTTISSRELNQDVSFAKRSASNGPVFITDRGKPSHVLLTVHAYRKITGGTDNIVDLLTMPGMDDIEFEPLR